MPIITGLNAKQALELVKQTVEARGVSAWIDTTKTFDLAQARQSFDTSRMLLSQPANHLQTGDVAEALVRSGQVEILVLDNRECAVSFKVLRNLEALSNQTPVVGGTFCDVILLERYADLGE